MQEPQLQPQPARKKSGNGCVIALLVVASIILVGSAAIAFGIYKVATSKEGKAVLGVMGEAVEAQNAPGTEEVRALGCDQAMAMDIDKLGKMFQALDAGAPPRDVFSTMVICQVGVFDKAKAPSCDDVARVYRPAGHPKRPFMVMVQTQGDRKASCTAVYDVDGHKISDVDAGAAPVMP